MTALGTVVYDTCHLTGEFVLRSGRVSGEYFDKYLFESDPAVLRRVAAAMVDLLPAEAQVLAGMEMGGIPVVTVMSQLSGLPAVFVRKQAKTYGTGKIAEGCSVRDRHVVGVEDVVTSAGALLAGCLALRDLGAHLTTAVCAIDREEGGARSLAEHGIALRAALTRAVLIP